MIQYFVILLDDTSVSYCHCDNPYRKHRLINLDDLRSGILYAMKENLTIQFVYPNYELPQEYLEIIDSIDHYDIKPVKSGEADVSVMEGLHDDCTTSNVVVLRVWKKELWNSYDVIASLLRHVQRINVIIKDLDSFVEEDLIPYNNLLDNLAGVLKKEYIKGRSPQLNLLTDRIMLKEPKHCNAGVDNITLAPNGLLYICPAFFFCDPSDNVGDLLHGPFIKNQQLFRLDHAPLCRHCDAYQCRRCVWMNCKTTLEVNTPSHEQCIVAHTERNAARRLLASIREAGQFLPGTEINEIDYLDPFDVYETLES